ncbi:TetR/AcrR family transcriptional regulator [Kitasatospora azatica]|uniref:TetR/AcrR family transcriptional regulator n=1 Tax=Kitasatospora azatica TaxID=58347 RepID=UPI00056ABA3A|nr:helix-turn-helix domain-containing protein [Kitasatospora azatica]
MADVKHFDPDIALDSAQQLFWRRGAAEVGIADVVTATGLSRSSLYATFGGKQQLYLAALERYIQQGSAPMLRQLSEDDRGLPAVAAFFARLVSIRCTGPRARWGCMIANAHAAGEGGDAQVATLLERHHALLVGALRAALERAGELGQLRPGAEPADLADVMVLLAYGVNLRSRSGADTAALQRPIAAFLASISVNTPTKEPL